MATVVEHHAAPAVGIELGYSVEVLNAISETLAVLTLPESDLDSLCRNEVLDVHDRKSDA